MQMTKTPIDCGDHRHRAEDGRQCCKRLGVRPEHRAAGLGGAAVILG